MIEGAFFGAMVLLTTIASIFSPDVAVFGGLAAAMVAAYSSARITGPNRRKIIAETGTLVDQRVLAFTDRVTAENTVLRDRVSKLEGKLEATEHRCDVLEQLLMEHGIPVPGQ